MAALNRSIALVCLGAALSIGAGVARSATIEEIVELPVVVTKANGRAVRHSIKVTIFRDDQRARSPFLILNHGGAIEQADRIKLGRARFFENSKYFLSMGFAVLVPTRMGYGVTGGPDVEDSGSCGKKNYAPAYDAAAQQSMAVIDYAKNLPYIDPAKGLVAGQSFGGMTAIALAARNIPGVLAAVNFAGGGGGNPQTRPERPCRDDLLAQLFSSYGAAARTPTLWLYSENDRYFGKEKPRAWFNAFVRRGGSGKFVQLPAFQADGHASFTANAASWRPAFEEFTNSCCGFAVIPGPQRVALKDTPEAFTQVFEAWASKYRIRAAALVVRRNGRIVHRAAIGTADPDAPFHLASLSKAITGACVVKLIQDGKLTFETPLGVSLAKFFAKHGKPADPRIASVTIAQLLTHRGGFSTENDPATGQNLTDYLAKHSSREPPKPAYLNTVFRKKLAYDPGRQYAYSNAGYLVLGAVIEEVTSNSYENYCRNAVLAPAGAAGDLEPVWRVMGSYGGWRMSGANYLAFLDQFDLHNWKLGTTIKDWTLNRAEKSFGDPHYPSWYGPGIRLRDWGRGIEISHTGSWRRTLSGSAETNTLAMHVPDGTSWFVYSTPVIYGEGRAELDDELLRAYQGVRRWD